MLTAALASALLLANIGALKLPSQAIAGRMFATPLVAGTKASMRLWVDSDGSGFLLRHAARKFHLRTDVLRVGGHSAPLAYLPEFEQGSAIPRVLGRHGGLPLIADDASDPIFAGIDGQLGASWLQDRIWLFDYPARRLWLLAAEPPHPASHEVQLLFEHDAAGRRLDGSQYPHMQVSVAGETMQMSLDTAATIALRPAVAAALSDHRPTVQAASS